MDALGHLAEQTATDSAAYEINRCYLKGNFDILKWQENSTYLVDKLEELKSAYNYVNRLDGVKGGVKEMAMGMIQTDFEEIGSMIWFLQTGATNSDEVDPFDMVRRTLSTKSTVQKQFFASDSIPIANVSDLPYLWAQDTEEGLAIIFESSGEYFRGYVTENTSLVKS